MKRFGILAFQFYRLLLLYNIAFYLMAAFILWFGLGFINRGVLLLAKIMGFPLAAFLHYYTSKDTYFYFRNAGLRLRHIFIASFAIDILIYVILATLFILASHAVA